MSLIFDALQRSEGERSGTDLVAPSAVTDLLQNIERQTLSEWEAAVQPAPADETEAAEHFAHLLPVATASETSVAPQVWPNDKEAGALVQFPSIRIPVPIPNRLICLTNSEGLVAEKFRFLGVRLRHLRRERTLKKVLITSTIPREGKSTVAANLACTLARKKQQRTLLLEGDVRRPFLSQMLGLVGKPGICEWLQGEYREISNIYHLEDLGLWILPAGTASSNPLELLQSGRLTALMEQLSTLFDWIIIDSPPVLPLADTSIWSRMADGILLVTRQGTTKKRQLQSGLEAIDQHKLLGALVNSSQSSLHSDNYYYYESAKVARSTDSEK